LFELLQGTIERLQIQVRRPRASRCKQVLAPGNPHRVAAAFSTVARSRMIHEYSTDNLCRHSEELCPVAPVDAVVVHQANECFMNQRGWLQRMSRVFGAPAPPGDALKLGIHQRHEVVQRRRLPFIPLQQECGDVGGWFTTQINPREEMACADCPLFQSGFANSFLLVIRFRGE